METSFRIRTIIGFALLPCLLFLSQPGRSQSATPHGKRFERSAPVLPVAQQVLSSPDDVYWETGFGLTGTNGTIMDITVDETGNVFVGGDFSVAGDIPVNSIVSYDGAQFHALGRGIRKSSSGGSPERTGRVWQSVPDGEGRLYVGGEFDLAGEVSAAGVALWDGSQWSPLGEGINGSVYSMALGPDGTLYVGGWFTQAGDMAARNVAMWDGEAWSPLGTGPEWSVDALTVDADGWPIAAWSGDVGDQRVVTVARWDGASWIPMGSGPPAQMVVSLAWDADGRLVAGGTSRFELPAGQESGVSVWDGATWSRLGSGVDDIWDLELDRNGVLYTTGWFEERYGHVGDGVAAWDGEKWVAACEEMNEGSDVVSFALGFDQENRLYLGGLFHRVEGVAASNIARHDGSTWSALHDGRGIDGVVQSVVADGEGGVYAAGSFDAAGTVLATGVAHWDGENWSTLGAGIDGTIWGLVLEEDGDLVAGGWFSEAGGVEAQNVARWNGSNWSPIGGGTEGLYALVGGDDGALYGAGLTSVRQWDGSSWSTLASVSGARALASDGTNLYVGGCFTSLNGQAISGLARWDGTSWTKVGGAGFTCVSALMVDEAGVLFAAHNPGSVSRVSVWDGVSWTDLGADFLSTSSCHSGCIKGLGEDDTGRLMAVGSFHEVGGVAANNVAVLNGGSRWSAAGSGITGFVNALSRRGGWVGGIFPMAGGSVSSSIARWSGDPVGFPIQITRIEVDAGGEVFAGGAFTTAASKSANPVMRWDGSAFRTLGAGLRRSSSDGRDYGYLYALTLDGANNLYAGGWFNLAGDVGANNVARWNGSRWDRLGDGLDGTVYALAIDAESRLYAMGEFTREGSEEPYHVAVWDGAAWGPVGTGFDWGIEDMVIDSEGKPVVGGSGQTPEGDHGVVVARWDGTSWASLGDGPPAGLVHTLALGPDGHLYAGGMSASDLPHEEDSGVYRWDGAEWSRVGAGIDDVYDVAFDRGGVLYAGGWYSKQFGSVADGIARWNGVEWVAPCSNYWGPLSQVWAVAFDPANRIYVGGAHGLIWDECTQALPLQVVGLEAVESNGTVLLRWQTEDDAQVAGYEVEHRRSLAAPPGIGDSSAPTTGWQNLGRVPGRQEVLRLASYEFTATGLSAGRHELRLRQIDLDGQIWVSPTVEVTVPLRLDGQVGIVYPNPFSDRAGVEMMFASARHVSVELYDALGRRVRTVFDGDVGENQRVRFTIDGAALAPGLYLLRTTGAQFESQQPIVKVD